MTYGFLAIDHNIGHRASFLSADVQLGGVPGWLYKVVTGLKRARHDEDLNV